MSLKNRAVYAGSFDPITYGHLDIIKRGARLVDELIVGIGENPKKRYLFDLETRVDMVKKEVQEIPNVSVLPFHGLLISFAKEVNAQVILRGLRAATDFDYEFQMGLVNMEIDNNIETIFLLSEPQNIFISSSTVKEIAFFQGNLTRYVSPAVAQKLEEIYAKKRS